MAYKKRLPPEPATQATPEAPVAVPEAEVTVEIPDQILLLFRKMDLDSTSLRKLKDFWVELSRGLEELGKFISTREQENAFKKCAVCGSDIRSHPMGSVPGFDKKTDLPIMLYCCTQTCYNKALSDMEQTSRLRMEERERSRNG